MGEILKVLEKIAESLSTTSIWDKASVVISLAAFITTLVVLIQNRKAMELSRASIQKSIDLAMYDKMIEVANNLEKNIYTNTTMEISILFGMDVLNEVKELQTLTAQLSRRERDRDRYNELLKQTDYDFELDYMATQEDVPEKILEQAAAQDAKYQVLEDYEFSNPMEIVSYDIEEIIEDISVLGENIKTKQKHLKNKIYHIMRDKFKMDNCQQSTKR